MGFRILITVGLNSFLITMSFWSHAAMQYSWLWPKESLSRCRYNTHLLLPPHPPIYMYIYIYVYTFVWNKTRLNLYGYKHIFIYISGVYMYLYNVGVHKLLEYIYIYICVCVCVCVFELFSQTYIYIYIYIYKVFVQSHAWELTFRVYRRWPSQLRP